MSVVFFAVPAQKTVNPQLKPTERNTRVILAYRRYLLAPWTRIVAVHTVFFPLAAPHDSFICFI